MRNLDYEEKEEAHKQASAEVLWTMNVMLEKFPLEFGHGMTHTEVKKKHTRLVEQGRFDHIHEVYDNKMRALWKDGLAGRHTVHGERHYFGVVKHQDKKIDHRYCDKCDIPVEAEFRRANEVKE